MLQQTLKFLNSPTTTIGKLLSQINNFMDTSISRDIRIIFDRHRITNPTIRPIVSTGSSSLSSATSRLYHPSTCSDFSTTQRTRPPHHGHCTEPDAMENETPHSNKLMQTLPPSTNSFRYYNDPRDQDSTGLYYRRYS